MVPLLQAIGGKTSTAGASGRGSRRFAFESLVDLKKKTRRSTRRQLAAAQKTSRPTHRDTRQPRRQLTAALISLVNNLAY